jgi:hypothetical protein
VCERTSSVKRAGGISGVRKVGKTIATAIESTDAAASSEYLGGAA